jgi:hypothetical protein
LTDNKPQQTAKYGKLRSKESGSICLDKVGTGGTEAMVDKPRIKKPVQKASSVVQPIDSTDKKDLPIAEESGDNWQIAVFTHPIVATLPSFHFMSNKISLYPLQIARSTINPFS